MLQDVYRDNSKKIFMKDIMAAAFRCSGVSFLYVNLLKKTDSMLS